MTSRNKPPRPERAATDQSLDQERTKTDHELSQRRQALEEDADAVLRRAQVTANGVLKAARDKEDLKLELTAAPPEMRASLSAERRLDDRVLQEERATAGQQLQEERKERARVLASLLAAEREQTDQYLLSERMQADEAVTARDSFLGIVSHDLRTMISAISLTADRLARNAAQDEAGRTLLGGLEQIQRTSARMHQLIGDLVDVSSIEAGRLAVTPMEHDAGQVLRDTVEAFEAAAQARGVALDLRVPQRPLLARYDYGRIIQVLTNLIGNALKFTPKGGRISVRAEAAEDEVRFSVEDTGPGLPWNSGRGGLFERFWKAPGNDRPGMGLGLFISRSIIEAHGGRIWAEPGAATGSIFHFTVPGVPNG